MHSFREYAQEQDLLTQLPHMDPVQQAQTDIALHQDAINKGSFAGHNTELDNDTSWKSKFIDILQNKEQNPQVIQQVIAKIKQDIQTHLGRISDEKTGSQNWHQTWVNIYQNWIKTLEKGDYAKT